mmetsp:Transcript_70485/g.117733  ORF Transcript_70485/g.117733 Transcript_70485/m.117733 type:complete len:227 (+) Transcript_70485:266-946(+)
MKQPPVGENSPSNCGWETLPVRVSHAPVFSSEISSYTIGLLSKMSAMPSSTTRSQTRNSGISSVEFLSPSQASKISSNLSSNLTISCAGGRPSSCRMHLMQSFTTSFVRCSLSNASKYVLAASSKLSVSAKKLRILAPSDTTALRTPTVCLYIMGLASRVSAITVKSTVISVLNSPNSIAPLPSTSTTWKISSNACKSSAGGSPNASPKPFKACAASGLVKPPVLD